VYDTGGEVREQYLRGVVVDEIVSGYRFDSGNPSQRQALTFHHDPVNSVTALSGHAGTSEEATRYDAFGTALNLQSPGTGNDLLFTGRELDRSTGLYYYRARYYDPEIGRFLSEDPLGFEAGVNFYAYVENNPINANDPMGEDVVYAGVQFGAASGGVGGSGQLAVGFDLNGNWWNPFDYYFIETGAVGGQMNIASYSGMAVGGYSTVDNPMDLAGAGGLVGGSLGFPAPPLVPTPTAGFDVVLGSDYTNFEGSLGLSGSVVMPGELHGMGAVTAVQNVGDTIADWGTGLVNSVTDFFTGGSNSSGASGGFVLYPSKPNLNQVESVYRK